MRFYCNSRIYKYFREYVESLLFENDKIILYTENENIEISDDNISNIFISYLPNLNYIKFKNLNNNIINLFYLNTEQLTRYDVKCFIENNLRVLINMSKLINNLKINILDYSLQNIKIFNKLAFLKEFNLNEIYHIPYQYNEKEINKLKTFSNNIKKEYEFSFCGIKSNYRNKILDELTKNNISNNIITNWYNERDLEICKSKVLLNIHYNKDYNIYESIRCDRWIFSGNLVLTENSFDDESNDLKDFMISTDYDNLVNKASKIMNNLNLYKNICFSPKKLILLQEIINKKKQTYMDFRKYYN
jgi:hypothetical protein